MAEIEPWMYDIIQAIADDCFDDEHYTEETIDTAVRRLAEAYARRSIDVKSESEVDDG